MKKGILLVTLLLLVVFLGACNKNSGNNKTDKTGKTKVSPGAERNINENQTSLYLIKMQKTELKNDELTNSVLPDNPNPEIKNTLPIDICSGKPVEVKIDGKFSPREILERLFTYKSSNETGIYNAFGDSKNIKIDKLEIKNNFAIVHLSGDFQSEDKMCAGQLMHNQIEKTLSQFDNIAGADIFVGDKEISEYISSLVDRQ